MLVPKKQILVRIMVCMMLLFAGCLSGVSEVKADIGPKPSVNINFEGLADKTYYVTLLSETSSTGPFSADKDQGQYYMDNDSLRKAHQKFMGFKDKDGYYYLQYLCECQNNEPFRWTYYPPNRFKILIYLPENDVLLESSEIYESYAFDSYFTAKVNLEGQNLDAVQDDIEVSKSYGFWSELGKLLIRTFMTIAIEIIIALMFLYYEKHDMKVIVLTNLLTQLFLNIAINLFLVRYSFLQYILVYIVLELLVFCIEAAVYKKHLSNMRNDQKRWPNLPVLYAFTANVVSFLAGCFLAYGSHTGQFF